MNAADIMTTNVITIHADTQLREIAALLLKHRISGLPVVNDDQHLIGIVSEGDLLRRVEIGTDDRHAWWLAEVLTTRDRSADYVKTHGRKAADLLTKGVITVGPDAPLYEIAGLLEKHQIKRVPVTRDGKLIGIVSRANLLHALAVEVDGNAAEADATQLSDRELRKKIMSELQEAAGIDAPLLNVIVNDGAVQLWGAVDTVNKKKAVQIAVESISGIKSIENNVGLVPRWVDAY